MTKALTLDEARERYRWNGTDSTFEGVAVAWFRKLSGKRMVVLEDDRGLLHVYPVTERLARQEIAALSDGEEQRTRDLLGDPRVGVSVGHIPETFGVSPALSDGVRTRADDAQVGGGAGQAGDDVVLDAASRLREAGYQILANTLQVHDAEQRQRIANLVQALRLQMIYEATVPDRGGKNGPKGRAYAAFVQARDAALKEVSS